MLSIPDGCSSRDGRHTERHDKVTARTVALRLYMELLVITERISRTTKKQNSVLRSIGSLRSDIGSLDQRFRCHSLSLQENYRKLWHSFFLPPPLQLQTCNVSRVGLIQWSLHLQAQVTLASLCWCHMAGYSMNLYARTSDYCCNHSRASSSTLLLTE